LTLQTVQVSTYRRRRKTYIDCHFCTGQVDRLVSPALSSNSRTTALQLAGRLLPRSACSVLDHSLYVLLHKVYRAVLVLLNRSAKQVILAIAVDIEVVIAK